MLCRSLVAARAWQPHTPYTKANEDAMDTTRPDNLAFQNLDSPGRGKSDPQRYTMYKTDYGERNTEYMPQTIYDDPDDLAEAPGDAHPVLPPPATQRSLLGTSTLAPVDPSSVIVREVPSVGGRRGRLTAGPTGSRFTKHVVNGNALVKRVLATAPTQHPYTRTHREVGDQDGVPVVQDLPIELWPFPGDQESRIVRYDDPRPTYYHGNPRPSYHAAVRSHNPDLVRKTLLNNSFLEDVSAEGLGAIQDPTGQLASTGINRSLVSEEWLACNPAVQALPCASEHGGGSAEGAATRRIKKDETPLGRAVAACQGASSAGAAAAMVRMLSEHPQCNPNLPTIYHDVEPAVPTTTASDTALLDGPAEPPPPPARPARRIRGAPAGRAVRRREPVAAAALRERAYYTLSVSPLYHALYFGLEDAAAVLLKNPLVDPRVGVASDDPRSRYETRRCSSLDPSLAALEEELDRVDAAQASPRAEGRVEALMAYEFAAAPRVSRQENTQSTSQVFANVGANVRSFY